MNILNEIWNDISGYESYYQVSSFGRVRSLPRRVNAACSSTKLMSGKLLKPRYCKNGYYYVCLQGFGIPKNITVHSLVANAFLGDRPNGFDVNHIDGDKSNNSFTNLEYCSRIQNIRHAFDTGLCHSRIGDNHHGSKLSSKDIPVIRDRLAIGHTQRSIAKDYGVSSSVISDISRGVAWVDA
jgi:hypothetical protein